MHYHTMLTLMPVFPPMTVFAPLSSVLPLQSNVRRMLGYFSLVGLLRVHSILGDYTTAIKVGLLAASMAAHTCAHGLSRQRARP